MSFSALSLNTLNISSASHSLLLRSSSVFFFNLPDSCLVLFYIFYLFVEALIVLIHSSPKYNTLNSYQVNYLIPFYYILPPPPQGFPFVCSFGLYFFFFIFLDSLFVSMPKIKQPPWRLKPPQYWGLDQEMNLTIYLPYLLIVYKIIVIVQGAYYILNSFQYLRVCQGLRGSHPSPRFRLIRSQTLR